MAVVLAACVSQPPLPTQPGNFCAVAQRLVNAAPERPTNRVFTGFDEFLRSKPALDPFLTTEYWTYGDSGAADPRMVSCKLVAADRLRARYGPRAAPEERPCRVINEATAARVYRDLSGRQSQLAFPPERLVLEPDLQSELGPAWLRTPQRVRAADGRLYVTAVAVLAALDDPRLGPAPASVRGTRNCHVIAPDYLRRLVTGEVPAPP